MAHRQTERRAQLERRLLGLNLERDSVRTELAAARRALAATEQALVAHRGQTVDVNQRVQGADWGRQQGQCQRKSQGAGLVGSI